MSEQKRLAPRANPFILINREVIKEMKLYLISQDFNDVYDTHDAAVVAAKNEEEARNTRVGYSYPMTWAPPEHVKVALIGNAVKGTAAGVILDSFNAG